MLDITADLTPCRATTNAAAPAPSRPPYSGPERRQAPPLQRWMAAMLDEIDYGMLMVGDDAQILHVNKAAMRDLGPAFPLQMLGRELRARCPQDVAPLREALDSAGRRGLRRLLRLGEGAERSTMAVVPLPLPEGAPGTPRPVLLVLGKRQMCEELSAEGFARAHGLTMAETAVLKGLCDGCAPKEIAEQQGVRLSTVRTQIGSIRSKTGAESIRALVRQVAVLPPLVSALQGLAAVGVPDVASANTQDGWRPLRA